MNRRGHCGRVDANHAEVIAALRKAGIAAVSTASVGDGFGDAVAALRGVTVMLEIKDGNKPLTADERKFHETWPGAIYVVRSAEEAITAVLDAVKAAGRI